MDALTDDELAAVLGQALPQCWPQIGSAVVEPLGGGMNSATARVRGSAARYVAKWVPDGLGAALRAGGERALEVQRVTGIPTGPPVPTATGEVVARTHGGWVSLLTEVDGAPFDGATAVEQELMARTLAAVHGATTLGPRRGGFLPEAPWHGPQLDVEPWVRAAVGQVRAEYETLAPQPWATLHTDPAPEAFLLDGDRPALIDWTGATDGPVLYDVASAVMYLGGPSRAEAFLRAYSDRTGADLTHLGAMRRYRQAVQAAYFAQRLAASDRTGLTDPAGNHKGLDDARRGLVSLGVIDGP
ncbi:phosphotransferase enzyme family protein [Occultella gossypii]|uniref:Phosphotransferase n=1 Tax=Occultella gossypii TaxID=2800820 RepID=A0ABS7SA61_9MICO|nr:phosphotransferase [Occultella gossypii]MBZ2197090.1 phosphotransferase [Occultella gossypii]